MDVGEAQPTVSRTTFGAASFVAGVGECEEKTVVLKIDNVSEFLAMSNDDMFKNGLTFRAGTCILKDGTRIRATWKYFFECDMTDSQDWIGGFFYFPVEDFGSAKAWYSVSLSSGGNTFASYSMPGCKEFDGSNDCGLQKWIRKSELLQKTEETNTLEVNLLVKVFSTQGFAPVLQQLSSNSPFDASEMRGQMTSDLKKMLESGDGTDVEVKVPKEVGGKVGKSSYTKKAHKAILMARSSVFSKMFAKESEMVEAKTGKVVITDLSPKGLDVFLHYLYTGEVLQDWVQILPEILNAAEKYACGKLKQFCGHNFLAAVTAANAFKMLKLAKLHSLSFAAKGVMEFIQKNAIEVFTEDAIHKVSDSGVLETE